MMGALGNYSLLLERKRKKHGIVKGKGCHKKHCPLSSEARGEIPRPDSRSNVK